MLVSLFLSLSLSEPLSYLSLRASPISLSLSLSEPLSYLSHSLSEPLSYLSLSLRASLLSLSLSLRASLLSLSLSQSLSPISLSSYIENCYMQETVLQCPTKTMPSITLGHYSSYSQKQNKTKKKTSSKIRKQYEKCCPQYFAWDRIE